CCPTPIRARSTCTSMNRGKSTFTKASSISKGIPFASVSRSSATTGPRSFASAPARRRIRSRRIGWSTARNKSYRDKISNLPPRDNLAFDLHFEGCYPPILTEPSHETYQHGVRERQTHPAKIYWRRR